MRTVNSDVVTASRASSRVVGAYMVTRDIRLKFLYEFIDTSWAETAKCFDTSEYTPEGGSTGITRITAYGADGTSAIFHYIYNLTLGTSRSIVVSTDIDAGSKPGVYGNRVYYQKNNTLYYMDIDMGNPLSLGEEVEIVELSDTDVRTAFALVEEGRGYVLFYHNDRTPKTAKLYELINDELFGSWDGTLYGDRNFLEFAAVNFGDKDYIFSDDGAKIIYMVKGTQDNSVFGEFLPVIPMDAIDDTGDLRLSGAKVVGDKIFVTGILYRLNGPKMHVYLMGPPPFTFGRDMFIGTQGTENPFDNGVVTVPALGTTIHMVDHVLYAYGVGVRFVAGATYLVGYDDPGRKVVVDLVQSVSLYDVENSSVMINAEISSQYDEIIKPGDIGELYVRFLVFDEEEEEYEWIGAKLCEFGIDTVAKDASVTGDWMYLVARGNATKRMGQWTSDYAYDLWSQIKQVANPADMSNLVIAKGKWSGDDDIATVKRVNDPSIMYSVSPPRKNTMARAKFEYPNDSKFKPEFGLLLNYYRRSNAEDPGVEVAQLLYSCIACTYDALSQKMKLYHVIDDTWNEIADNSHTLDPDTSYYIEARFDDGAIKISTREDGETAWNEALYYVMDDPAQSPWPRDQVGRAGIYINNYTPSSLSPGFSSESTIIPVYDIGNFTSFNETVIVDDEQIRVTAASPDYTVEGLVVCDGELYMNATHENTGWGLGTVMQRLQPDEPLAFEVASRVDNRYFGKSITLDGWAVVNKVGLLISKVGSPPPLYFVLATDQYDFGPPIPDPAAIIEVVAVSPFEAMTWAYAEFDYVGLQAGNYFLVLTTSSTGYEGGGGSATYDPANYYKVYYDPDFGYEKSVTITLLDFTEHSGIGVPYYLYGIWNRGDGYAIYVEGVDSPAKDRSIYDGCALVVYDGEEIAFVSEITDYDSQAPGFWTPSKGYIPPDKWQDHIGDLAHGSWVAPNKRRIFVRENPSGKVSSGMTAKIIPALKVSERGYNETSATSHSSKGSDLRVSIYRDMSAETDAFEYYDDAIDMTFEDAATHLARLAGVLDVTAEKHLYETIDVSHENWSIDSDVSYTERIGKNMIVKFERVANDEDAIALCFRMEKEGGSYSGGYMVVLTSDTVSLYSDVVSMALVQEYTIPTGRYITASVFDQFVSVWDEHGLLTTFVVPETAGRYNGLAGKGDVFGIVDWPELDMRINDLLIGDGRNAMQIMSELIGQKHIYFGDGQDGDLRLYRSFTDIPEEYTLEVIDQASNSDVEMATRVRVEGIDMYEAISETDMREYGNLYVLSNAKEANTMEDLEKEASYIIADMGRKANAVACVGAADPRVQPFDRITVDGREVVVSRMNMSIRVDEVSAVFDMKLDGYYA